MPIQIRQTKPETDDPEIQTFYNSLLTMVNEPIFHGGNWRLKEVFEDVDDTFKNLVAYLWKMGDELRLVIINLNHTPARGRICFQDDVSEALECRFKEMFSGRTYFSSGLLMAHPGLSFNADGYQAQIFDISPK